ncbi:polypeptide Pns11 [Wound tumor virus]|uniref:Suppressor of RNA-mediated gene silencing n=1 Tax=Wound tumor virus TaxID=10987 RepID=VSR_WTV|nr:polypeptide Pns11 [Wound tumor virus]P13094.1 RecName: Full=Suppressor of RNA-mediated gene silencing; AltName: Full=Non-structural protein 10; Short=Pns10 [Wound tumor virus]AAA48505.1 polypeptide Pns11 [Wound tumor virus]
MDASVDRITNLHFEILAKAGGHEIHQKYEAIRKLNLTGDSSKSNISVSARSAILKWADAKQGYIASQLDDRDYGDLIAKAVIFVPMSVITGGKNPKDLIPYGVVAAVLIFVPETLTLLDEIVINLMHDKKPLSSILLTKILRDMKIDVCGSNFDSFYYCPISRYNRHIIKLAGALPQMPTSVRLSVNDLARVAISEVHNQLISDKQMFFKLPTGFSPKVHCLKVLCTTEMEIFQKWVRTFMSDRPNEFIYSDQFNILSRTTYFSSDDPFSFFTLWRGWSTYKEILSQDQASSFLEAIGSGKPLRSSIATFPSMFDEGAIYIRYEWITPKDSANSKKAGSSAPSAPKM